jgi:hypothetical protein
MTSDETSLTFGLGAISSSTTSDATSISCCTSSTSIARTSSIDALAFLLQILTHPYLGGANLFLYP